MIIVELVIPSITDALAVSLMQSNKDDRPLPRNTQRQGAPLLLGATERDVPPRGDG